ncbi:hypothetical protein GQX73_g3797 [Xylaria multiplex]|uniref:Uncharacterized protein n=1 Tax=Xylaria multiplex TaxID=323545 RepID=A0A7C8N6T8_9PEZI|nr:hypothetical protein GQX73_g3797 [Xylaria multiplex]
MPIIVDIALYKVLDERDPNHWAIHINDGETAVILQVGDDEGGVGYFVEKPIYNKEPSRSGRHEESITVGVIPESSFDAAVSIIQATPVDNVSPTWNCQAWAVQALDSLASAGLFQWDEEAKATVSVNPKTTFFVQRRIDTRCSNHIAGRDNAGVQVGISKVNITIADVDAELKLIIRLGNLVDIVDRRLETPNLDPLLINVIDGVTNLVDTVVAAVDGLLGTIVNGDPKINPIIDNLGNIVQEVEGTAGDLFSSIVGNYEQNMTYTGAQEILDGGLIQKTYSYSPLNALVNIVFNSLGQVVKAVVVKRNGPSSTSTSSTGAPSSIATL